MLRLLTIGVTCVVLGLAAGCGGDDENGGGSGGAAATGSESAPAETQAASSSSSTGDEITVTIKGFAFQPAEVDAKVGQTIKWVNEDDAPHNAVAQNGGNLKTKTFEKGGSDTFTLDAPGTIQYICTVHPQMKGTIKVTE